MMKVPGSNVSLLTKNRHLNAYAWSIPAGPGVCAGFNLEGDSVCRMCYAGQGFYFMPVVKEAQHTRLLWWRNTYPVVRNLVMINAINSATRRNPYFRVFESGDFTDEEDVNSWKEIIRRCPATKFWISTRAWRDPKLSWFLTTIRGHNVVVRYSGIEVNDSRRRTLKQMGPFAAEMMKPLHTSSVVDSGKGCPKQIYGSCTLGECRACWDPQVKHIEYKIHGNLVRWRKP